MSRHRARTTLPRAAKLLVAPAAGALAIGFISVLVPASAFAADRDCGDFASRADAQAYFNANGGSMTTNVDRLDANSNGLACENEVYPTTGADVGSNADLPAGAPETGDGSVGGIFRLF